MGLAPAFRTAAILVGHLGGFALLWIVQFVVLDRMLFGRSPSSSSTVLDAAWSPAGDALPRGA